MKALASIACLWALVPVMRGGGNGGSNNRKHYLAMTTGSIPKSARAPSLPEVFNWVNERLGTEVDEIRNNIDPNKLQVAVKMHKIADDWVSKNPKLVGKSGSKAGEILRNGYIVRWQDPEDHALPPHKPH